MLRVIQLGHLLNLRYFPLIFAGREKPETWTFFYESRKFCVQKKPIIQIKVLTFKRNKKFLIVSPVVVNVIKVCYAASNSEKVENTAAS